MDKILLTLEYNKVIDKLMDFCDTADGKAIVKNLSPIFDKKNIEIALKETDSAYSFLRQFEAPSFIGLTNIDDIIIRLEKGGSLNIIEFLVLYNLINVTSRIIKYRKNKEENTVLDKYFNNLNPLNNENSEIKKIINIDKLNFDVKDIENIDRAREVIYDDASNILLAIRRKKKVLTDRVKTEANKLLNFYRNELQEQIIANKGGRICLAFKIENKNKIDGTVLDVSNKGYTVFIEPKQISSLNNEITNLTAEEDIEINKILFSLSQKFITCILDLKTNYNTLVKLDFIFAKAKYATITSSTLPTFSDNLYINIKGGRHPLIDNNVFVPLDIKLGEEYNQLIITGPNTGGKTICLKTIGLIELMAMSGLFIPARENSIVAFFDNVYADIGDEQSIEQSLSTFSAHMKNIIYILNNATKNSLCLFDELCVGTDPVEGANLAISILTFLKNKNTTVVATTHYPEIKMFALSNDRVKNASFEFDVNTLKPTYKLIIGIPGKSNAFAISEKLGLNKDIIDNAKKLVDKKDAKFEDIVSNLYEDRINIDKEKKELEKTKYEITELKEKVNRQQKGLNDRYDSTLRKAKEEARSILLEAKKLADETIKNIKNTNNDIHSTNIEKNKISKKLQEIDESLIEKIKGPKNPISPKKIKLGQKVRVLSLKTDGIVETLPDKDYNLYVRIGILKTKVSLRDLENIDDTNISLDDKKLKRNPYSKDISSIKIEKTYTISSEINIIGKTVDEALSILDKYIDDAYLSKIPKIRIIHGRGTGALKNAVHTLLKKQSFIKNYYLADFNEGGDGATIVEFN